MTLWKSTAAVACAIVFVVGLAQPVAAASTTPEVVLPRITGTSTSQGAEYESCAGVLFIGIRGSGEAADSNEGYGRMVVNVRDGIEASLRSDITLREVALDFPARPVPDLVGDILGGHNG